MLPSHPVIVSSFSNKEMEAFEDEALIRRMKQQRRDYYQTYHAFSSHMCGYFMKIEAPWSDRLWACTLDGFLWGFTMATTRSVTSHRFIIPLMDFRNFISTDSVVSLPLFSVALRPRRPFSRKDAHREP